MSLRNQPYFPFYVNDFLADERLRRCSASAYGVYICLMCLLHKSETYGEITLREREKKSENQIKNFAFILLSQVSFPLEVIEDALDQLLYFGVIQIEGDTLSQKRMVKDGEISNIRAESGSKGGRPKKQNESKPKSKTKANLKANEKQNTENEYEYEYENENVIESEIVNKDELQVIKIKDLWNKLGLSQIRTITKTRKQSINARIKEYGFDTVSEVISGIKDSPFLMGKNDRGWTPTIDWVMKPDKFVSLLEGNYKPKITEKKSGLQELIENIEKGAYDE